MKQELMELKGEIDKITIVFGYFSVVFSVADGIISQKNQRGHRIQNNMVKERTHKRNQKIFRT